MEASAGDVMMVNLGEIHDGYTRRGQKRGLRMLYFSPSLIDREIQEALNIKIGEIHPAVRDPALTIHFAALFACVTDLHSDPLERTFSEVANRASIRCDRTGE